MESLILVRRSHKSLKLFLIANIFLVMDLEKGEDRLINFKREVASKAEMSDEDF